MMYQIETPLPCEQRVVLETLANGAQDTAHFAATVATTPVLPADFTDKSGRVLAPYLADMAQRGGGVLLLNLAADTLSLWLARERAVLLAQGTDVLCRAGACTEIVVCVPQECKGAQTVAAAMQREMQGAASTTDTCENIKHDSKKADPAQQSAAHVPLQGSEAQAFLKTFSQVLAAHGVTPQFRNVPASPVLREETALYTALDTGTVRVHPLCASFLSEGWQHRPCCAVDGETACAAFAAAQGLPRTKLVALCTTDKQTASVREVPLGTALLQLCLPETLTKPVLLGENPSVFASQQALALAEETAAFCWRHDAVTLIAPSACMADCAARLLQAAAAQSCHNCVLCREGSWHLESIFSGITQGKAKRDDLALVEDIAPIIADGALCAFGRTLAQTALTAVQTQTVRTELEAHIIKKTCPAGVCTAFSNYVVLPDKCTGCGDCLDVCTEDAIEGKNGFIHMIDADLCEKCGKCAVECEEKAIVRSAEKIRVPKKLTRVGRFS